MICKECGSMLSDFEMTWYDGKCQSCHKKQDIKDGWSETKRNFKLMDTNYKKEE